MPYIYEDYTVNTDFLTDNHASGGEGGSPFEFIKLDKGAVLTRIKAWKDDWRLRGVEVWMSDGTSYLTGERGGTPSEFSFQNGELITKLNIQASAPYSSVLSRRRLGAIYFETSKNRNWGLYANSLSDDAQYWQEVGSGICVGIFGGGGAAVDRLGFAMLREVDRAILTDVTYPKLDLEIVASTPETVAHQVFSNGTDHVQTFTLSGSRTVTITREWSISTTLSATMSVEVSAGIPTVGDVSGSFSWTISATATYGVSTTETSVKSWQWPLTCPAHTQILGDATMFADNIDTEYVGVMELHLKNGKTYKYTMNGVYTGLNARSGHVTIKTLGPYHGK